MKVAKLFTILTISILAVSGCTKLSVPESEKKTTVPENFKDIKASQSFSWTTTKTIAVTINGLGADLNIYNTLKIGNKNYSTLYYQGRHSINENLSLDISVPGIQDSVYLKFGSIEKAYSINGINHLNADYIVADESE